MIRCCVNVFPVKSKIVYSCYDPVSKRVVPILKKINTTYYNKYDYDNE